MKAYKRQKRSEKKIAIVLSYINIIITNIANLFYVPILLRQLGAEEYGLFSLCSSLIEYLAVINFGYASAYIRYYSIFKEEQDENKIKSLNGIMLGIYIFLGMIVLLLGIVLTFNVEAVIGNRFGKNEYELAGRLIIILVLNLSITFPGSVFEAIIAAHERFAFLRLIEIFKNVAIPLAGIMFLLIGFHSLSLAVIMLSVTSIVFVANSLYCLCNLKITFWFKNIQPTLVWDIFCFSFFLLLQSIADCMNWQVDKLILARVAGSAAIAYYTVGAKINSMMMNFSGAVYSVFIPEVNRLVAKDKYNNNISLLFIKVGRIQFMIMAYIYIGFLILGKEFIQIWAGTEYHSSYIVAALLTCPLLLQAPMQIGVAVLRAQNKNGLLNVFYLGICIINIVFSIPLSLKYEELGAAFGSFVSLIVAWSIIAIVFFKRSGKINMKRIIKEIYQVGAGMISPFLFMMMVIRLFCLSGLYAVIVYGLLYTMLYWGALYVFSMNQAEKNIVNRVWMFLPFVKKMKVKNKEKYRDKS